MFLLNAFIIVVILLQLSLLPSPLPSSTQPSPSSHGQPPHCCPCPWVIHTCFLTDTFPSFHHYSFPLSPLAVVSLFPVSMSLVIFCLLVNFFHQIPLISEIIWSLSFTNQLISLSIIVSSSIHTVTKGRSSFFSSDAQYSIV